MSTTSPARLAANRRNALKSTGPKTPEGKAASRLNAFKHGLAGEGDLLAPSEDAQLVEHRSEVFARELGAVGEVGGLLAHRAALLSVRMDTLGERRMLATAASKAEARAQFDRERFDEIEGWINDLDDPKTLRPALEALEAIPEGVDYLILTWEEMLAAIRSGDALAPVRAALWLGWDDEESKALKADPTDRISAELARLRLKSGSMTDQIRRIDVLRERAATLARFDPSPEETLARRYEAAAERGMYRAMRAIAETRRAREINLPPLSRTNSLPPSPTPAPRPAPTPLGSFRAEVSATPNPLIQPPLNPVEPSISDAERRKKRPDPRKLAQNRR